MSDDEVQECSSVAISYLYATCVKMPANRTKHQHVFRRVRLRAGKYTRRMGGLGASASQNTN